MKDIYSGFVHTANVPITSTPIRVYDGKGNPLPIRIANDSVEISHITYPSLDGVPDGLLYKDENDLVLTKPVPSDLLENVGSAGTYTDIGSVTINERGFITNIANVASTDTNPLKVTTTTYFSVPFALGGMPLSYIREGNTAPGTLTQEYPIDGNVDNPPVLPSNVKTLLLHISIPQTRLTSPSDFAFPTAEVYKQQTLFNVNAAASTRDKEGFPFFYRNLQLSTQETQKVLGDVVWGDFGISAVAKVTKRTVEDVTYASIKIVENGSFVALLGEMEMAQVYVTIIGYQT